MAIQKTKTVKGIDCNYWRIVQLNQNYDRQDAVMTLALYVNKDTRDADPIGNVMDSYQTDLAINYHDKLYSNGEDEMRNVDRKEAYRVFLAKAQAEAEKEDDKDEALAWFADAVSV